MSLNIWHLQDLHKPSSCATYTLKTLSGEELPQVKKVLCLCTEGCFSHVQLFATMWTEACQAFLLRWGEGVLQARILECIGQYWLSYPSRVQYFLLP